MGRKTEYWHLPCLLSMFSLLSCHGLKFDRTTKSTLKSGCHLQPGMSRSECVFPNRVSGSLDLAGYKKHTESAEGKAANGMADERMEVPDGSVCMVNPTSGDDNILFCEHGKWTQREQQMAWTHANQRFRRGFHDWLCDVFGWHCRRTPPPNQRPTITWPSIQSKFYAREGEEDVKVSWSSATAWDPEDGSLSTRLTSSITPGGRFSEGTYNVSYEAKDSKGAAATCTVQFEVIVRRCSVSHIQTSAHMESPVCIPRPGGKPPVFGTTCTYRCEPGYELSGVSTAKCNSSGAWTDNKPICRVKHCPPFNLSSSANVTCSDDNVYGSECTITCDVGYELTGDTTQTCLENGTWSGQQPICQLKHCPPFNLSSSANVTCSDDNVYGSVCTITCDVGYELTGDTTQTCLENGTWSGQQPICQRSTCGKPDLDNTGLMVYDCPSDGYFFGESCSIRCNNGHPASGAHLITCESNLTDATGPKFVWNGKGSVAPTCQTGICQKLRTPKNGALACNSLGSSGETCTVLCDDQYMRPRAAPDRYICLPPSLTWNPNTYVPDCLIRRRPNQAIVQPDFYYSSGTYRANSEIKERFLRMLKRSDLWTVYCNNNGNFSCTVFGVNVGVVTGKPRLAVLSGDALAVTTQISPQIGLGPFREQKSITETRTFYDNLAVDLGNELQKETGNGAFDLPEIGTFDGLQASLVEYECPPGTFLDQTTLSCAGCGKGHIYNTRSESCMACPVGTYQDQEIASSCIQCPKGTTTRNGRAASAQECTGTTTAGQGS